MTEIPFIAHEAAVSRLERVNKRLIFLTIIQTVICFIETAIIFTTFTTLTGKWKN